jgi:hypothetical protein
VRRLHQSGGQNCGTSYDIGGAQHDRGASGDHYNRANSYDNDPSHNHGPSSDYQHHIGRSLVTELRQRRQ